MAPPNDELLNAIAIAAGGSAAGTTAEASADAGQTDYFGAGSTVWYSYTPAADGAAAFNFAPGSAATSLLVWSLPAGTPPTIAGLQAVENNGGDAASTVQFYAQAGRVYYLQVGSPVGAEGAFTLASVAPDPAIDVTPPPNPVIAAVTDAAGTPVDATAAASSLIFSGTGGEPQSTIVIKGNPAGVDTELASGVVNADGTWAVTVTNLAPGSYSFGAIARDAAGNQSIGSSNIIPLALEAAPPADTTPPDAPLITGLANTAGAVAAGGVSAEAVLIVSGTAEANSTVKLYNGATEIGTAAANASGVWTITTTALAEASYSLTATATDAALNVSPQAAPVAVTVDLPDPVDTTPPAAPQILAVANAAGPIGADGVSATAVLTLSGTAEAGSTLTLFNGETTIATTTTKADGTWSVDTPALAEGTYNFTAVATDAANNVSPQSPVAAGVTIDLPDPSAPPAPLALTLDPASDTGVVGNGMTADTTPTITGTAADGDTITLYNGTTVLGTATASNGAWSITPAQALAAGAYSLTATATDPVTGLTSAVSEALALTINAKRDAASFPANAPGFDTAYYLATNPDVKAGGIDALQHYLQYGWAEGRDPNALFDVSYYLNQNADVAATRSDPLAHYIRFGWTEGRDPSLGFGTKAYLAANADVAGAGINPLLHYLYDGMAEERAVAPSTPRLGPQDPLVDAKFYYAANPDVAKDGLDPSRHFADFGWKEGRDPNAFFDVDYYLARYADVAAGKENPLLHYLQFGAGEGRDPSAAFSTSGYLAANPDVAAQKVNPLQHYLEFGIAENRPLAPPAAAAGEGELV